MQELISGFRPHGGQSLWRSKRRCVYVDRECEGRGRKHRQPAGGLHGPTRSTQL